MDKGHAGLFDEGNVLAKEVLGGRDPERPRLEGGRVRPEIPFQDIKLRRRPVTPEAMNSLPAFFSADRSPPNTVPVFSVCLHQPHDRHAMGEMPQPGAQSARSQ